MTLPSIIDGCHLVATFDTAPPPPEATVTVNPRGVANKDGSATLSGTYSCSNADDFFSDIEGTLTQRPGDDQRLLLRQPDSV